MDANKILQDLLQSGKQVAAKGEELFGDKVGIPEAGPERDAMLKGLGKGAAAAGVLALLLGTGAGRRLTGTALKLGSLGAVGVLGYKALQNWQAKNGQTGGLGTPVNELQGDEAQARSRAMLRSMIAAARADGHIDQAEQAHIESEMAKLDLGVDVADFVKQELDSPLDVKRVAEGATTQEAAVEIWLASRMVVDNGNSLEKAYLDELADALDLAPDLVGELESQLAAA